MNKIKYCGDADICKVRCRIASSMTVKASWVGGNTDISCQYNLVYGLGFTVALLAKLELGIEIVKKVSYPT